MHSLWLFGMRMKGKIMNAIIVPALGHLQIDEVYGYFDEPVLFSAVSAAGRGFLCVLVSEDC